MGVLNSYASPEGNAKAIMAVRRYSIFRDMVKEIDPEVAKNMNSYQILGYDKLFEWVLATLCNITWTDVVGKDFSNNMDLKCRTILQNKKGCYSLKVNSLNNKVGDIVTVVYNASTEQFRFFLLPYKEWRANYNPRSDKGYFNMSFPRDRWAESNWWNDYEVKDLYSLVKVIRKATKVSK
jgi:hypothetical protein